MKVQDQLIVEQPLHSRNFSQSQMSKHKLEQVLMIQRDQLIKQTLYLLVLGVIIGVEFAYRKPLYDRSISLQEALQSHITNGGKIVFEILSYWGEGVPYFLAFIYMFLQEDRGRAFYYVMFLTTTMWVMNITKMAYHEPRPFIETIIPYGCSSEYGNPSGHSIFAAAFDVFFYLDLFHAKESASMTKKSGRKVCQGISLFVAVALAFLIGFARFYVGVHTINQIVYGWTWGLWLAFYFHYCLREPIIEHINTLLTNHPPSYTILIVLSSMAAIVVFFSQIATYLIVDAVFTPDPIWLARIASKCNSNGQKKCQQCDSQI